MAGIGKGMACQARQACRSGDQESTDPASHTNVLICKLRNLSQTSSKIVDIGGDFS
jgi:hypothetical protein